MTIDLGILDKLKARVQLARKIETAQHKVKKVNHDRKWMKETADALGVELDSDIAKYALLFLPHVDPFSLFLRVYILFSQSDDQEPFPAFKRKGQNLQLAAMKAKLREMLSQPLIARGISTAFITSGSHRIVDDLLAGDC